MKQQTISLSRRQVLLYGSAALALTSIGSLWAVPAQASPKDAKQKLAELTGGAEISKGRIHITLPKLAHDGTRVRIKIQTDSPMTPDDYVRAIHILGERNTLPEIASYQFTPECGKAELITRIRLAKSQTIVAAAEMNDGSVYIAKARCNVARGAGGCG
ncbi:MAG: thiosulfate oxidation carrier protein SoxY [Rhodospirillales bacterium]|jgi:sulfur-oxidizing protein SoxY|nr:thiosulfate oxidation carrier protein SoxY [Rhodospirillales bacterium]